ncbi:TspO protein [Sporosarcina sp. P21c]|uniref:TspO/MBR family protein n=1 Tax=unclassified Sporosarcina TaxID=2647733 RepID=UPI000C164462|nr:MULTISPECIES: TspO/MBR family protein [unclassified Sporosarcina]PIC66325.1 TspO protein [Sporosarcina sp. P16a]PIC82615.1 TspO protein [Sporosarcina sp. P1]PIC89208.1 TspO protein [Sporosarcina sp. P21c]PIC92277.1 TspO protein [Sporosarcina sp. P25]
MELLKVQSELDWKKLTRNVLIPVVGGSIIGYLANRNTQEQYAKLEKPSFSPPSAVFPIAWTTLYTMMGVANYRVEMKQGTKAAPPLYDIQLGLNFLWSFLFFKWNLRGTALIEMTIMLGTIAMTAYEFNKTDRTAGALMVPYIGWVMFALVLNYSTWKLNK